MVDAYGGGGCDGVGTNRYRAGSLGAAAIVRERGHALRGLSI